MHDIPIIWVRRKIDSYSHVNSRVLSNDWIFIVLICFFSERIEQLQSDIRTLHEKVFVADEICAITWKLERTYCMFKISSFCIQTTNMSRAAKLAQQLSEEEVSSATKVLACFAGTFPNIDTHKSACLHKGQACQ